MRDNFELSLKRVLVYEGGKIDHPKDPGGRTNQGITQRVYNAYRARKDLPARDVHVMTTDERDEIYDVQYWQAVKGDELPIGLDGVVFDGAVNSGPKQSIKWLQRALGVKADGVLGQVTLSAIEEHHDHDKLIDEICARRLAFLQALKTWGTFGKGWKRRLDQVEDNGQAQAMGSVGAPPVYFAGGEAKALIEDAKKAPTTALANIGIGGGVSVSGLLAAFKAQVEPYVGVLPQLDTVVATISVAAAVIGLAGGLYALWARRKTAALAEALDLDTAGAAA